VVRNFGTWSVIWVFYRNVFRNMNFKIDEPLDLQIPFTNNKKLCEKADRIKMHYFQRKHV